MAYILHNKYLARGSILLEENINKSISVESIRHLHLKTKAILKPNKT